MAAIAHGYRQFGVFDLGRRLTAELPGGFQQQEQAALPRVIRRQAAPIAFGEAGVSPAEIDVLMAYDSFSITVMCLIEDLGFCKKGEGGQFVGDGHLVFDDPRKPALNTDGGGLSSNHPGQRGLFLLLEATRQLRGESTSQVKDAKLAVAVGNGGQLGSRHATAVTILATD